MKKLILLLLFIPIVSLFYFPVSGFPGSPEKTQINSDPDLKGYFVDAKNGDDDNSGKQLDSPWKTIEKINSIIFEPGDNVYFKRGTSYSHGLQINGNGTKDTAGYDGSCPNCKVNLADYIDKCKIPCKNCRDPAWKCPQDVGGK